MIYVTGDTHGDFLAAGTSDIITRREKWDPTA